MKRPSSIKSACTVDDKVMELSFVKVALVENNIRQVTIYPDPAAILYGVRKAHVDLILIGLFMEEMYAVDFMRLLKEQQKDAILPYVVALDAKPSVKQVQECKDNGIDDFLICPFSINTLGAHLSYVLQKTSALQKHGQNQDAQDDNKGAE